MSDVWPLHGDGQRFETAGTVAATTSLTDIPENAAANTKGAYAELIASTAFDAVGFLLNICFTPANSRSMLLDIAVGAAASETVILADIAFTHGSASFSTHLVYIPLPIPAASRVSARYATTTVATANLMVAVNLVGAGFAGGSPYGKAETWGATAADSGGIQVVPGVTNAKGSYSQIVAASAFDVNAIIVCVGNSAADYALAAQRYLFDVAVGGAGVEQILFTDLLFAADVFEDSPHQQIMGPFPCMIPAGSRVAVRAQTSAGTTDNFDFVIIGFST
jgi:hypothetical protein